MMLPSIFGENLFDDFMNLPFEKENGLFGKKDELFGKHGKNIMKTDVKETKDTYLLDVDLPGFKKDEITLELENGYLTISASKGLEKTEKGKEDNYIRKERYTGQCARSFYVGDNVKPEDIKAKYEDGILAIQVPKIDNKKIEQKNYISIE